MKWLRILLPIFLVLGLLLSVGSVAYAEEPIDDPGPDMPLEDPGPDEGGLTVDITVIGNNSDLGVDLYGDDNTANVNFHSENPTVLINGQNINEPTVIIQKGDSGTSKGWVMKRIDQAVGSLYAWAGETEQVLNLTMDGLAKVIMTIKDQDSQLGETSAEVDELYTGLDDLYTRLEGIDGDVAALEGEHDSLVDEVRANHQALLFEMELMEWEHNRNLVIMAGAFLLVVMGLAVGFGVSIYRLRKRI